MESEQISYAQAMAQLEEIVARIDQGEVDVDDLAASVKQAVLLVRSCRERLQSTQEEVEQALREMEEASGASADSSELPLTRQGAAVAPNGATGTDLFVDE